LGYCISAPAFAVIIIVTLFPIIFATGMSFAHVSAVTGGLSFDWAGLANYRTVLASASLHHALVFTALFALIAVVIGLLVGTSVALVLDEMSHGRALVLALMLVPYSMITVIVAELWAYILNGLYGVANYILVSVHLIHQPVTFLNTTVGAFSSIVLAEEWKTVPFITLIVLAGLRMVDRELYAAAKVDGAGWWARMTHITLPLVKPAIVTAAIFRILQSWGLFDMVFVLTGGGPGSSTQSVAMLMYNTLFLNFNLGQGATISTVTMGIVLIISISVLGVFRLQVSEGDG
jgi:multiple sugar transport system permease protein